MNEAGETKGRLTSSTISYTWLETNHVRVYQSAKESRYIHGRPIMVETSHSLHAIIARTAAVTARAPGTMHHATVQQNTAI